MLARQRDAYLAHVTVERGLSANTIAAYRRDLDRLLRLSRVSRHRRPLADVSRDDIADFAQSLGEAADGWGRRGARLGLPHRGLRTRLSSLCGA